MDHFCVTLTVVAFVVELHRCSNSLVFCAMSLKTNLLAQLFVFEPPASERVSSGSLIVLILAEDGVFISLLRKQRLLLVWEIPNQSETPQNCTCGE